SSDDTLTRGPLVYRHKLGEGTAVKSRIALCARGPLLAACLAGCGPVLEATRDTPVNLDHIAVGESRVNVISDLGAPLSTVRNGNNDCDVYKLCTEGPGGAGKAAIA